ncbi:hypothetical protein FACS1894137_18910 [Spirochaetia bacterium]|nr:hypothetical protein FACS1894137_18910 [Spirochaetia bacterium]
MTIQQTLTVPKATKHLTVDLPQPVPAGMVDVVFSFKTADDTIDTFHDDWRSLYGLCKNSGDTLDAFMERHHEEGRLELENEERERRER